MQTGAGVTGPVNLGNPVEVGIRDLAERVLALTGSTCALERQPLPQDDPRQRKPDIALAETLLGWRPSVDLDTGLTQTIAFFRALLADLDRS